MTKVSIILTSYNKPLYVGQAIESVLQQTEKDWELFIMDDNSHEETCRIIHSYLGDSRIFYINSRIENDKRFQTTRYASLINQAIPLTTGKYLTYLTDDTVYMSNRLQRMLEFFYKNPRSNIVYSSQEIQYLNQNYTITFVMETRAEEVLTCAANVVDHCSVMHSREVIEKVFLKYGNYWDENPKYWCNGDAAFWTRLNTFECFHPIQEVLDVTKKTPHSYQNLSFLLPDVLPNGTVVKGLKDELYVIDQQKRRSLSNEMFKRLKFQKIVEIPDPVLFRYNQGVPITEETLSNQLLVQSNKGNSIYYIQKNQKRLIENQKTFLKYNFDEQKVIEVDSSYLKYLPDGPNLTENINKKTILPDGVVFSFEQKYYISLANHLCFIQTDIAGLKFKLPLSKAVPLSESEFLCFLQGTSYTWESPSI